MHRPPRLPVHKSDDAGRVGPLPPLPPPPPFPPCDFRIRQGREQDRASPARIQGVPAGTSRELCTRLRHDFPAPSQRQSEKTEMALVRRPRLTKHPANVRAKVRRCPGANVGRSRSRAHRADASISGAATSSSSSSSSLSSSSSSSSFTPSTAQSPEGTRIRHSASRIPHPAAGRRAQAKQRLGAADASGEESATVHDGTAARAPLSPIGHLQRALAHRLG